MGSLLQEAWELFAWLCLCEDPPEHEDTNNTALLRNQQGQKEEGQGQAQGPDTTQAQGQSPSVARSRAASRAARAEARTHKYAVRYQADPNHDDANETPTHGAGPPVRQRTFESDTEPNMLVQDDEFDVHKLGKIQFNLKYDFQEMTLTLKIMRAIDLPAKDFSGTSDPYVKIMLLPDKKHKLQTNIKRRNLNPRWNELFAFEGFPYSKLQNRTLYMQVLDYDRFSRDDPIGEIAIPLCDADLATGQTMWKALQPCKGGSGKLGEILISMCYQPTVGRITVVVMKCRELKAKDITGTSDPYVKIWMHHEGKKIEKKKTTIKERELNPVFNESFIFNVPYEKIRQTQLVVSVMDYDRMGRNELIGSIVLGSKSGPMEVKHWNEMFSKSRQPVAQWHILKDFG